MKVALVTTDSRENYRQYNNPVPYFGTAPQALLQGFASLPQVTLHVLACAQQRMTSPEKLAPNIWFHSLNVPKAGWMRSGYTGCIWAVRRRLGQIKPDIVHGQGTERDCAMDAVFSGYPNVLTIHGNMRSLARLSGARPLSFGWVAARLEELALRRTNGVVCITRYTREAVTGLARRTWLVPNAVDPTFFEVPRQPMATPIVLCVGSVCLHKNQNFFIRALDGLASEIPFRLVFLGGVQESDTYGAEFLRLVAERPWCQFAGFAVRSELKEWLSRSAVLALPSLEDNCPMVVLEAMAANVPVAAARIGGVPDLVRHNETGLLCDPRISEDLRSMIEKLLRDTEFSQCIANRARTEAMERFAPERIAQQHFEIYRDVLSACS